MIRHFRNAFISGSLLLLPLAITIFVVNLLLDKFGAPVGQIILNLLKLDIPDQSLLKLLVNAIALLVVVIVITMVGLITKYFVGKWFFSLGEKIIDRLPFVNTVYKSVKQIVDTFSRDQKAVFQKVVLVEYPRKGCYGIGFLTGTAKGEVNERTHQNVVNVFIPTTPNPTSGFLLLFPEDEITVLDMSITDGMKLIISGGAVVPPYPKPALPQEGNSPSTIPENA